MSRNLDTHYISGETGTTGREPFEDPNTTAAFANTTKQSGNPLENALSGGGTTTGGRVGGVDAQSRGYEQNSGVGRLGSGSGSGSGGIGQGAGVGAATRDYANVAPNAADAHSHGHGAGNTGTAEYNQGISAYGVGAPAQSASHTQAHAHAHEHEHEHEHEHGHGRSHGQSGTDANTRTGNPGTHVDRVGHQGQDSALYEQTGSKGVSTSGAAGTERFDTGSHGAKHGSAEGQITDQRAPGKSSGGIGGLLGTSDKDFTGRERLGDGAYADTHGTFKSNQSGPSGHTALTGREGNLDNNPIAQAKSREAGAGTGAGQGRGTDEGENKGMMDKIKDAFK